MRTGSLRQMVAGGLTQLGWEMLPSINALAEFGT